MNNNKRLIFIVDTQADVSIIRINELGNMNQINSIKKKITLRGITDGTIESRDGHSTTM